LQKSVLWALATLCASCGSHGGKRRDGGSPPADAGREAAAPDVDAGPLCQGQPLTGNPTGYPLCLPASEMVLCTTCAGMSHPGCGTVCMQGYCWECGSQGWLLGGIDCPRDCIIADAASEAPATAGPDLAVDVAVEIAVEAPAYDAPITVDEGPDAPLADAPLDAATPGCGDAATCGTGQACVLISGGPRPLCAAPSDAGTCTAGLVLVASCSDPSTGSERRPGCSTPPPSPHCAQLADGCGDPCACLCPGGGAGCFPAFGYTVCSLP
jgi:hypothetical protein